jgi:hypothetical protein
MIFQGNKVEVIASYTNGKGAKIRVGSNGYITNISPNISYLANRDNQIIIVPAVIVFSRYGFEKKHRSESKEVSLVYPGFNGYGYNITDMKKFLNSMINFVLSVYKNKINSKLIAIRKSYEPTNILIRKSDRTAWLRSVITHELNKYISPIEFRDREKFICEVERVDPEVLKVIEDLFNAIREWDHKKEMLLINYVADNIDVFKSIYIIINNLLSNTARYSIDLSKRNENMRMRENRERYYSTCLQLAMNGLNIGHAEDIMKSRIKKFAYRVERDYRKVKIQ